MTLDEARAYVIKKFIYIEEVVDSLIIREIQPRVDRSKFFAEILLNTAIIPTSGKFKLIRYLIKLNNWPSIKEVHFHRLLSIRNQFAHSSGRMHLTGNITTIGTEEVMTGELQFILESLDGSGSMQRVDYRDAIKEFDKHYAELRKVLHSIRDLKD